MIAPFTADTRFEQYEELDRFERFSPRRTGTIPTHCSVSAKKGRLRTRASQQASRRISRQSGGMHRRRKPIAFLAKATRFLNAERGRE